MHPLFLSISVTICYSSSYLIFRLIPLYTLRFVPFNMLNGSERTMLLWKLSAELEQLNKKLRSLALSITVFNFEDVWNRAIAGKIEKTNGMLAEDARKRQSKAMRQVAKFYAIRQHSKPWFK